MKIEVLVPFSSLSLSLPPTFIPHKLTAISFALKKYIKKLRQKHLISSILHLVEALYVI